MDLEPLVCVRKEESGRPKAVLSLRFHLFLCDAVC